MELALQRLRLIGVWTWPADARTFAGWPENQRAMSATGARRDCSA